MQYEAEAIPGVERFAMAELRRKLGAAISEIHLMRPGFLRFYYGGPAQRLAALRSVTAIYRIHDFDVPRPKALLGHRHFARLMRILGETAAAFPAPPLTLGIGAAGSHSSVMRRLLTELADALDLQSAEDGKGDLFMRLLRQHQSGGWQVLVRSTPQPLSKRAYRRVDVPGALNAAVAFMLAEASPLPDSATALNLCSGSSTILIELGLTRARPRLIAIDSSAGMLAAGRTNAEAAGLGDRIQHIRADATRAPLPPRSAHALYADLPFGHYIGSHSANIELYPRLLEEASRLARPDARFALLTHEVNLMRRTLQHSSWNVLSETRIDLKGLHPRLFVLNQNLNTI